MKLANTISLRVFRLPEDDKEEIEEAFLTLLGYDKDEIKKQNIQYSAKKAKGFQEKTITLIEAILSKDRHCNKFLQRLSGEISDDDKELLMSQTNRLDDYLNFFIRLDKKLFLENEWKLTDSGDCFHIKINVATYPRRKDVAHKAIRNIFSA